MLPTPAARWQGPICSNPTHTEGRGYLLALQPPPGTRPGPARPGGGMWLKLWGAGCTPVSWNSPATGGSPSSACPCLPLVPWACSWAGMGGREGVGAAGAVLSDTSVAVIHLGHDGGPLPWRPSQMAHLSQQALPKGLAPGEQAPPGGQEILQTGCWWWEGPRPVGSLQSQLGQDRA